jgi:hypothetical protein
MIFSKNNILASIKIYLIQFIQAQLFITTIILPILVFWGLPISVMSFVGNLIFTPFLAIIITISTMIFFTQLSSIPNGFLVYILNQTIDLWDKILNYSSNRWMIELANPGLKINVIIPIVAILALQNKRINTPAKRIIALSIIVLISFCSMFFYKFTIKPSHTLKYENKFLAQKNTNKEISFTDNGFFNKKKSIQKALDFELKPYLIKEFGTSNIKELKLCKPGLRTFEGASEFCNIFCVKQVTLPFFKNKINKQAWRSFFKLRKHLHNKKIPLVRKHSCSKKNNLK